MEKYVNILHQYPLQSRTYTDRDGQQRIFHSRGFHLTDGIDEFYAEMQGEGATLAGEVDPNAIHRVQCFLKARRYTDKNGAERFDNQVIITKLI
ncbi:MAG: hypothetical protein J6K31_04520 [Parabacteroides sp.]|nr:hypothetical protein [Parabacteroides sp.]